MGVSSLGEVCGAEGVGCTGDATTDREGAASQFFTG